MSTSGKPSAARCADAGFIACRNVTRCVKPIEANGLINVFAAAFEKVCKVLKKWEPCQISLSARARLRHDASTTWLFRGIG